MPVRRTLAVGALLAAMLLLPLASLPGGWATQAPHALEVRVDGLVDTVDLQPYDPRSPVLAAREPGVASGIYRGALAASGAELTLVAQPWFNLGVLALSSGPRYVMLDANSVVPAPPEAMEAHAIDVELEPPEPLSPRPDAAQDGKLQILLDGEYEYYRTLGPLWDEYQLATFAIVGAIYEANLGVAIEVVQQHVWTFDGLPGLIRCSGGPDDLLRQFRDHWESASPTTADAREAAHLFSRKPAAPHPLGGFLIGCGYIGSLESPYAYAASRIGYYGVAQTGPLAPAPSVNTNLVAHELGHNFAGLHSRAMPTPFGPLDLLGGCLVPPTIMYPYVDCNSPPMFSDAHGVAEPTLEALGVMADGGNAPHMRAHAAARV